MPVALVPSEVGALSAKDPTLELVRQAVISGDWSKLQGTTYKMVKDELWVIGQLVMHGKRIVMPESLWNRTVLLAHEGQFWNRKSEYITFNMNQIVGCYNTCM